MTILEAIQANPIFADLSVNHIQSVLSSRSIDGATTSTESSLKEVELASADLYSDMCLLPEYKEGQLFVKYNPVLLKERAKSFYAKYNDPKLKDLEPKPINVGVSFEDV